MKASRASQSLWCLSITTTADAEEAVSEFLSLRYGQPVSSYLDIERGNTIVTAWFQQRPRWTAAEKSKLRERIAILRKCGLPSRALKVALKRLRKKDWAEAWRKHFKPMQIGASLLIKPGWSATRLRKGQKLIVLEPGLSFGTGQHPTTAFCLEQVAAESRKPKPSSFLDLGTGSGILAIAAAKLRFTPVEAIDHDPDALRVAAINARRNRVNHRIHFAHQDLSELPLVAREKYSLICANLLAGILIAERDRVLGRLSPDGVLVLAGILNEEFVAVQKTYEAAGLRLLAAQTTREWRSGAFGWR